MSAGLIDLEAERRRRGWEPSLCRMLGDAPVTLIEELFQGIPEQVRRVMMAAAFREYANHLRANDPTAFLRWAEQVAPGASPPKQRRRRRTGWTPTLVACGNAGA
jgi:hypothetical protein